MKTNLIDETKMSSYIRTESTKLYAVIRDDVPGNLREFCRRIKWQVRQNVNGDTDIADFDIVWNDGGWCRIVDRITQIPCTKWYSGSNYYLAVKELYSIVKK